MAAHTQRCAHDSLHWGKWQREENKLTKQAVGRQEVHWTWLQRLTEKEKPWA